MKFRQSVSVSFSLWASVLFFEMILLGFSGCRPGIAKVTEKPVVSINQLQLTREDLKQEMKIQPLHAVQATPGQEPEWLSRMIEREILVQEAQRLGLDRNPEFMQSIERFWKEALIKQLLNRKEKEISALTHVYEPDVEAKYQEIVKDKAPDETVEPLPILREQITRTVQQDKESQALESWISDLRKQAQIAVDQEALSQL